MEFSLHLPAHIYGHLLCAQCHAGCWGYNRRGQADLQELPICPGQRQHIQVNWQGCVSWLDAEERRTGLRPSALGALVALSFQSPRLGSVGLSGDTHRKDDRVPAQSTVSTGCGCSPISARTRSGTPRDRAGESTARPLSCSSSLLKSAGHQAPAQAAGRPGDPSQLRCLVSRSLVLKWPKGTWPFSASRLIIDHLLSLLCSLKQPRSRAAVVTKV